MDCTVVIPTRNRAETLARCLGCLAEQDFPRSRREVIVVDDGSTDGTPDLLRRAAADTGLTVMATPRPSGSAAARNVALAHAAGEIVVFLDDDALAPPWLVSAHMRAHRRRPGIMVDGPAITTTRPHAPPFDCVSARVLARLDVIGRAFVTVNASAPLAAVRACGGFDESMLRWADTDLERRLRLFGLGRVRERRAWVWHWKPAPRTRRDVTEAEEASGYWAGVYFARWRDGRARRQAGIRYLVYAGLLDRLGMPDAAPVARVRAYAAGLRRGLRHAGADGRGRPCGGGPA